MPARFRVLQGENTRAEGEVFGAGSFIRRNWSLDQILLDSDNRGFAGPLRFFWGSWVAGVEQKLGVLNGG